MRLAQYDASVLCVTGAIGSKAWSSGSPVGNGSGLSPPSWLGANKDTLAPGYGLTGIEPLSPMTPETPSFPSAPADNMGQYMFTPGYQQPTTIMQKLQAERRRRLLDYQQKVINGM